MNGYLVLGVLGFGAMCIGVYYCIGFKDGYRKGWEEAQHWLVTLESEVDQARQQIWKEEGAGKEERWP